MAGLLSRDRIVAGPGFNRWLVPPAALAIHLSIGQAYAFSVFKLPLTKVLGITQPAPGDWSQPELAWIFSLAIFFLGASAAVFGRWLERAGPRKSGVVAAFCWSFGFFLSAIGVKTHQLWLLYIGYGVLGGCGLGIGYITPVSTLIKWFPDRRGMATGMAIMGFGGGALIASPLSQILLDHFRSVSSVGVAQSFVTLGCLYLVAMLFGAFLFRVPTQGWKPAGWTPPAVTSHTLITQRHVHVDQATKTAPFYFLWAVLFLNVTAGIGILEQASPMIQEVFKGTVKAGAAAGFVGLLSLFNMAGRFAWSSLSDRFGRKRTYAVFFTLGPLLYVTLPYAGRIGSVELFVVAAALILTMYGGGFATIPAYLSDIFGTQYVGAIHGRLLTAWSIAGIAGPILVNYIREYQIGHGVPPAQAYNFTMYLMAVLLVIGFFCNLAVRPVADRFYMTDQELAMERATVG
jgi:MFS family permease